MWSIKCIFKKKKVAVLFKPSRACLRPWGSSMLAVFFSDGYHERMIKGTEKKERTPHHRSLFSLSLLFPFLLPYISILAVYIFFILLLAGFFSNGLFWSFFFSWVYGPCAPSRIQVINCYWVICIQSFRLLSFGGVRALHLWFVIYHFYSWKIISSYKSGHVSQCMPLARPRWNCLERAT